MLILVPKAFFYSLLANFATRTASFIFFLLALRSALRVANFQTKTMILKESLGDQGIKMLGDGSCISYPEIRGYSVNKVMYV